MSGERRKSGRSQKKIERFVIEEKKEKTAEVFGEGDGIPLEEVEAVSTYIGKIKSDHDLLKGLHMILYSRAGTVTNRKRNIRKFNGFVYDDKLTRDKISTKLMESKKWTVATLKDLAMFLGLEKSGSKADLVERVVDFLECPRAKGSKKKRVAQKTKKAPTKKRKVEEDKAGGDDDSDDEVIAKVDSKKQRVEDDVEDDGEGDGGDGDTEDKEDESKEELKEDEAKEEETKEEEAKEEDAKEQESKNGEEPKEEGAKEEEDKKLE